MMARVAFVIASHSDLLARGVVELAQQMAPEVFFQAAGGTDEGGIGTSFDKIDAAVSACLDKVGDDDGAGVVILTDLGSATMTVESVLDFADDPDHLKFIEAPLVEGAVAAAVRAQLGDCLNDVADAARNAIGPMIELHSKQQDQQAPSAPTDGVTDTAVVADPVGLHARPAALLARLAATFDAEILVNGTDAASVLEIMALGVKQGETVELRATGPQAAESIVALKEMIENAS
ncbi:dihydroxyacetone kinase phosphoryl donor subunit DhaM [Pauljensenia sp. UMB1235]|uniref:dihydroxyacetone kinase phosphoryl donor subunit DhaM n=1 Tax=unclassified Pauljensenia TaxID=2908895 RepID=UPI00254E4BF9|nr:MULTISPECIES: dihydroxyacetone kinase phosphoryl donor subunit DhaM [unclassified Pauljensenia]MDK6400349.1 dihydroxyacetone kinase phosphoryl donor subunit DhaM [Pauljensenia sp. UMB9872]MDK7172850.1 dihydroxyacetone kinase phosphoryl donor subunit DhaM [Pauljensenia sp. UMB1235]